jgi:hypothetical protein
MMGSAAEEEEEEEEEEKEEMEGMEMEEEEEEERVRGLRLLTEETRRGEEEEEEETEDIFGCAVMGASDEHQGKPGKSNLERKNKLNKVGRARGRLFLPEVSTLLIWPT